LSLLTAVVLVLAFGGKHCGLELTRSSQFSLIVMGGFLATCAVGPAAAIVIGPSTPAYDRPERRCCRFSRTFLDWLGDRSSPAGCRMRSVGNGAHVDPDGLRRRGAVVLAARRTHAFECDGGQVSLSPRGGPLAINRRIWPRIVTAVGARVAAHRPWLVRAESGLI
jgi:hypothetical protein